MKYLPLFLILFSCTHPIKPVPAAHYPRIVHNTCTDLWAIQTGRFRLLSIVETGNQEMYVGTGEAPEWVREGYVGYTEGKDTIQHAPLGHEVTFIDSLSALRYVLRAEHQADSIAAVADSIAKAAKEQQRIADSLFWCHHNYR